MKLVWALFVLLASSGYVWAQTWLSDEFDARLLNFQEKRFLQTALVLSGDYVALLDGAWGQGSQRALERYTIRNFGTAKPNFANLSALLIDAEEEIARSGWRTVNYNSTDTSYAHPFGILVPKTGQDVIEYNSVDESMSLIIEFGSLEETIAIHGYFLDNALPYPEPYQNYELDRIITSLTLPGGLKTYTRSDLLNVGYVTLSIIATAANVNRMALIASSMQRGVAPSLTIPDGGLLDQIAHPSAKADDLPGIGVSALPSAQESTVPAVVGAGSAFYISPNVLLTAEHVIAGCQSITLEDGTELSLISRSVGLDLAILRTPTASPTWLNISSGSSAVLGERVMAIGYPYYGTLHQGLTATSGNVSAMAGLDGGSDDIVFTAPVQPGNSGGPLLNLQGKVLGVVVARVDDLAMLEGTGTLPQNMNVAVPPGAVAGFLSDTHVVLSDSPIENFQLDTGIPDQVAAAVVAVTCTG